MMAIRTRVVDDLIREAVADGVDLVLNLGAGLDTPLPYGASCESLLGGVDCAEIIELKESCLFGEKPVCKLERVSCDLRCLARQALLASASEKSRTRCSDRRRIPYLSEEEVEPWPPTSTSTLFPTLVADYFSPFIRKYRQGQSKKILENAPFKFAPKDYFGFFLSHGWQAKDVRYIVDAAQKLGDLLPHGFVSCSHFADCS